MIRTWIVTIALLIAACGCQDNQKMTVWGLSGQDSDLVARVGIEGNNIEVFGTAKWFGGRIDEVEPDGIGMGLLYHLTQDISIDDEPPVSPFQGFLESFHARPYVGLEAIGAIEGDSTVRPNVIIGTTFRLEPLDDWMFAVEYIDGDGIVSASGDSKVFIGARGRF